MEFISHLRDVPRHDIYPNVVMIIKQLGRNLLCRVENETDSAFMNITLFLKRFLLIILFWKIRVLIEISYWSMK